MPPGAHRSPEGGIVNAGAQTVNIHGKAFGSHTAQGGHSGGAGRDRDATTGASGYGAPHVNTGIMNLGRGQVNVADSYIGGQYIDQATYGHGPSSGPVPSGGWADREAELSARDPEE
jgi:hypothetical protein